VRGPKLRISLFSQGSGPGHCGRRQGVGPEPSEFSKSKGWSGSHRRLSWKPLHLVLCASQGGHSSGFGVRALRRPPSVVEQTSTSHLGKHQVEQDQVGIGSASPRPALDGRLSAHSTRKTPVFPGAPHQFPHVLVVLDSRMQGWRMGAGSLAACKALQDPVSNEGGRTFNCCKQKRILQEKAVLSLKSNRISLIGLFSEHLPSPNSKTKPSTKPVLGVAMEQTRRPAALAKHANHSFRLLFRFGRVVKPPKG